MICQPRSPLTREAKKTGIDVGNFFPVHGHFWTSSLLVATNL